MKPLFTLSFVMSLAISHGAEEDMLRFLNGDQLHGAFLGIGEGPFLQWKREDMRDPVELKPEQVRQVVLRGGRPERALESLSHVVLVNGDRIPGEVVGLDEESLILDTSYAGTLKFPRNSVAMMAPSPLGGRVIYQGPFAGDEWEYVTRSGEEGDAPENPWNFGGSAWYWQKGDLGGALAMKEGMPDRSVLRFNLAWKGRLSMAFAFHSDFSPPAAELDEANVGIRHRGVDASGFPWIFGHSYVLLVSHHVVLYRTGFDEEGMPIIEPVRSVNSNLRFGDSGEMTVELRCNRLSGEISLFMDGEFFGQWSEGSEEQSYAGKGSGFGFMTQVENTSVRISEVILAEWNGMPDAARSLETDDQDIVLLTNGTDRFSGKVKAYEDGKIHLGGRYGDFRFPLEEVAEIRFARNGLVKGEQPSGGHLAIRMRPMGKISGRPLEGNASAVKLLHPHAGEVEVGLGGAVLLDFNPSNSFLDEWDEQF